VALSPHVPELSALELLLAVARTGSLGAAGRELGLTQQAVSARMRTVERQVGVRLLHRSTRGSALTDAGALVADWAGSVLAAAEQLDASVAALRAERDDHLDVAASYTVAEYLVPAWLVRLRADLGPATGVNLVVRNTAQVADLVLTGHADLGFVEGPDLPPGLDTAVVATDELVLVVAPDHRWARRRTRVVTPRELAATALVTRERGSGTRVVLDQALAAAAPDVPRTPPALELSATTAIRHAVIAGAGPAVLSVLAVRDDLAAHRLVRVRIGGPGGVDGGVQGGTLDLRREIRSVWPEGPPPAGPARELLRIAGARR
jgi:DNA-binding transcriptional LysR family regulator